jgi:hypothetical protein
LEVSSLAFQTLLVEPVPGREKELRQQWSEFALHGVGRAVEFTGEPGVVIGETASWRAPHVHEEEHVAAMLGVGQMGGIGQICIRP